jgi:hypothetical protein
MFHALVLRIENTFDIQIYWKNVKFVLHLFIYMFVYLFVNTFIYVSNVFSIHDVHV